MNECELIAFVSGIACAISKCYSEDEINLISTIFSQIGDTLQTILVQRERNSKEKDCNNKENDNKVNDNNQDCDSNRDCDNQRYDTKLNCNPKECNNEN